MNLKEINILEVGIAGLFIFSMLSIYLWGRLDALPDYEVISTHFEYHKTLKLFKISMLGVFINMALILWYGPHPEGS